MSPPFAFSWIADSYYLISMVHGLLGFEFLNHGTHSTIIYGIVCSDITSHTCIISNILLDRYKKVTGIGAFKNVICVHINVI